MNIFDRLVRWALVDWIGLRHEIGFIAVLLVSVVALPSAEVFWKSVSVTDMAAPCSNAWLLLPPPFMRGDGSIMPSPMFIVVII